MDINPVLNDDPKVQALADTRKMVCEFSTDLKIADAERFVIAADNLKFIQAALKDIEDARVKITKPINDGLRAVNAQAQTASAPFILARDDIKRAMLIYASEQDRIRIEQQRKLDAEAERERKRLAAISDAAEAKGQGAKAESFASRAATVVAPIAQSAAPAIKGISMPTRWTFHVEQPLLVPREYLIVDEAKIRKVVAALKGDAKINGVRIYEEKSVSAGRG